MTGIIELERAHRRVCGGGLAPIRREAYFGTKPDETPPSHQRGSLVHNNLRFISGRRRPVLLPQIRPQEELRGARRSYEDQKSAKRLKPSASSAPACSRIALAHITAQTFRLFTLMCTSVQLRAPLCGKMKKSKMVHKPHITAHGDTCDHLHLVAPSCINLRRKNLRGSIGLGLN